MKFFQIIKTRISIIIDLLNALGHRKLWWLLPIVILLLVIGILVIFAQTTTVAPFVYTTF